MHEKLIQLLKLYFFIGGMPEAVAEYAKTEKLNVDQRNSTGNLKCL